MRRYAEAAGRASLAAWRSVEQTFDAAFGSAGNPLRQLGALGFLSAWLLAASGIYLYAFLDTSAAGAYRSIDQLSQQQPWLGGMLRSLHRYAADAFVIVMAAHVAREWLHGHYRGFRRFSWLTGVPLVALALVSAVGGFWIHWDRLGQYSAIASTEWLDALPLLAAPLARNFLSIDAVSDRLFSLLVFVHIGVPLLLLFGLWFHIQRLTRAAAWPTHSRRVGLLATLALLAVVQPVTSHAPADLTSVPQTLRFDWFLLGIHPLADATCLPTFWFGCGICAGACPSSTPFRSAAALVTGIDMPQATIGALRERLRHSLAASNGGRPIVVFGCDRGARVEALAEPDVAAFSLLCTAQLPPSFVDYALRDGAAAVLVSACREGGCEFRLGERWTDERLRGVREPYLRADVPRERVALAWAGVGDEATLRRALQRLRRAVGSLQHA